MTKRLECFFSGPYVIAGRNRKELLLELDAIINNFEYPHCGGAGHIYESIHKGRNFISKLAQMERFDFID